MTGGARRMKRPNIENAIIDPRKLTEYLLSPTHPFGRSKAEFFALFGFSLDNWSVLATALLRHAAEHDVVDVEEVRFGATYAIEGAIDAPDSRRPIIRRIWQIDIGENSPRFITAFPARWRDADAGT